ncbi:MAG: Hsp20/alpha crystallin family protein [Rikenellaceae bacterium]|nr:Hsp20/alpha crystallin family protein [Rikenellaceae bacterium]
MLPARRNQNNWLPSIFNDFLGSEWLEHRNSITPAVNILETDTEYKVEVAAPGMTREDFKVHINEDNELMISLEKRTEQKEEDKEKMKKKGTYLRREFSYTQFRQSLLLPDNIERDKISACVENGVMTIEIPKKTTTSATVARQIEVK